MGLARAKNVNRYRGMGFESIQFFDLFQRFFRKLHKDASCAVFDGKTGADARVAYGENRLSCPSVTGKVDPVSFDPFLFLRFKNSGFINAAVFQNGLSAPLVFTIAAYQWTFYTFVFLSLASLVSVQVLWFVPFYWILMIFFIFSMGHRSFVASLLGLMLPYWFMATWTLWRYGDDFTPFLDHFKPLADIQFPIDYSVIPLPVILTVGFLTAIYATGVVHYLRTSYNDKIRIRQIFYSFIFLYFIAMLFLIVQPQHYDLMLRMMIITVSPLIAHFISLTYTRITNIAFFVIVGTALILTVFNIWSSSFIF